MWEGRGVGRDLQREDRCARPVQGAPKNSSWSRSWAYRGTSLMFESCKEQVRKLSSVTTRREVGIFENMVKVDKMVKADGAGTTKVNLCSHVQLFRQPSATNLGAQRYICWEGCRESRRCSRDTYPESCITKYTS